MIECEVSADMGTFTAADDVDYRDRYADEMELVCGLCHQVWRSPMDRQYCPGCEDEIEWALANGMTLEEIGLGETW